MWDRVKIEIWTQEVKQRLIDSIMHQFNTENNIYLKYGYFRRLNMIRVSYDNIINIIWSSRETPLELDDSQVVHEAINSFYIHVCGAIDNLVWAYIYEKCSDEDKFFKDNPKKVQLFPEKRKIFSEEICGKLSEFKTEYEKLKEKRNPIAHRFPLYFPNQIRKSDVKEFHKSRSDLVDFKGYEELRDIEDIEAYSNKKLSNFNDAQNKLLKFRRTMCFINNEGYVKEYPIYPTVPNDLNLLLHIAKIILDDIKP